jgi:hypothetical protein
MKSIDQFETLSAAHFKARKQLIGGPGCIPGEGKCAPAAISRRTVGQE